MLEELKAGDVLVYRGMVPREESRLWHVSSITGGGVIVFQKTDYGTVITDFLREDDLIDFDILDTLRFLIRESKI